MEGGRDRNGVQSARAQTNKVKARRAHAVHKTCTISVVHSPCSVSSVPTRAHVHDTYTYTYTRTRHHKSAHQPFWFLLHRTVPHARKSWPRAHSEGAPECSCSQGSEVSQGSRCGKTFCKLATERCHPRGQLYDVNHARKAGDVYRQYEMSLEVWRINQEIVAVLQPISRTGRSTCRAPSTRRYPSCCRPSTA